VKKGKILVTGGTSGLGYELVKCFLHEGYEVVATGRTQSRIINKDSRSRFVKVDFSDLNEVAGSIGKLLDHDGPFDIIINNAGVLSPSVFTLSHNGIEYTFQVNFLSHLLIDELFIRRMEPSANLTIVSVTSPVYKYVRPDYRRPVKEKYQPFRTYAESKFYLLMMGEYLHNIHADKDIKVISYDPGTFSSGIYRMQGRSFRNLYTIAAPFMKKPGRVAGNIFNVLNSNPVNLAIYSGKEKMRFMKKSYLADSEAFWQDCYKILNPYLSPK
jgi:NAD(P)-dependent dehydrogenase (short-subunit alcohol dehydrogenase family)